MSRPPLLCYAELSARAADFLERAEDPQKLGWRQLIEVLEELENSSATTARLTDRNWSLHRLRVEGYQGVGGQAPIVLEFDPTPGVTVIHGPNGAGKSSVADALYLALHGATRASAGGAGGNLPLWDRVHRARSAARTHVDVILGCGRERLTLSVELSSTGEVASRTATRSVNGGPAEQVNLGADWSAALAAVRPVFSYADLDRGVQTAGGLQRYLVDLLALGGCFASMEREVAERSAEAKQARDAWRTALREVKTNMAVVDQHWGDGRDPLPDIAWPELSDEPDAWLSASGLDFEQQQQLRHVREDLEHDASTSAGDLRIALEALEAREISLVARLAGPLRQLHDAADEEVEPGLTCPVCSTDEVDWVASLREALRTEGDLGGARVRLQEALTTAVLLLDEVADVAAVLDGVEGASVGERHALTMLRLLRQHGTQGPAAVRGGIPALAEWLASPDFGGRVARARALTDHRRQWRSARAASLVPFVEVWRAGRVRGLTVDGWDATTRCITRLRDKLYDERGRTLSDLIGAPVRELLNDVGLSLQSLNVQHRQARVVLTDARGEVPLAELSAGQRNALLLAPLLTEVSASAFGFFVVDDPVHALDDLRVDRLAALLGQLGSRRRVIVLTHDARLKEHLIARNAGADLRSIDRSPDSGQVEVGHDTAIWQRLIEDARGALRLSLQESAVVNLRPDDLIRGLCRQAVDAALRVRIIRLAAQDGLDVAEHVSRLDAEWETKARLIFVRRLEERQEVDRKVSHARTFLDPYLDGWNAASHGNAPRTSADEVEVQACQSACEALVSA